MLNTKMKRSALSLILAVVLMFSVFSVSVFAETETEVDGTEADVTETEVVTDGATTDDGHDHDHDHEEEEKKGLTTFDIVSLIILGVLIIVGAVYCIKNREKGNGEDQCAKHGDPSVKHGSFFHDSVLIPFFTFLRSLPVANYLVSL